jgi:hypothetical protein
MFWLRRRRGTKVRLPVTAWPEIAVWVMMGTPQLHTGVAPTVGSARAGLKPGATPRLLKEGRKGAIELRGRIKATMFPIINEIRKLRSYRQDPLGGVHKPLITKDIYFWISTPDWICY